MKYLLLLILALSLNTNPKMKQLYNFSSDTNTRDWLVVNDGVMGGVSNSQLSLTKEGHGLFKGQVSLDNNGGFASIQLRTNFAVSDKHEKIVMRIKGDGKPYEFRLKGSNSQRESYVQPFTTSGEWQTIELQIADFYPQFRGRKLNLPNFDFDQITQVSFLIANKKEEYFELLIDWVGVE